jgi:hypothetical protein
MIGWVVETVTQAAFAEMTVLTGIKAYLKVLLRKRCSTRDQNASKMG